MSTQAAPSRRWVPPNHDGIDDAQEVSIDLDEKDLSKSIQVQRTDGRQTRQPQQRGSGREEDGFKDKERKIQQRIVRERLSTERRVRQEVANQQAAQQRQISSLQQENQQLRAKRTEAPNDAAHQAAIRSLQDKLEAAFEKGDSKEAARLQVEISTVQSAFEAAKMRALLGDQQQPVQQRQAPVVNAPTPLKAEAQRWKSANPWFQTAGYELISSAIETADQQLLDRGSDADDPKHYERIRKIVNQAIPASKKLIRSPDDEEDGFDPYLDGLVDEEPGEEEGETQEQLRERARKAQRKKKDDLDDDDDPDIELEEPRRKAGRAPVVQTDDEVRGSRRDQGAGNSRRQTITAEERREMAKFGLDATNPEHAKAWVKERMAGEE